MKMLLTALVLLVACGDNAAPNAPLVYVRQLAPDVTPRDAYLDAAAGWSPLGLEFTFDDPGMLQCEGVWKAGDDPNCEIVVWLQRVPGLVQTAHTKALTDPETRTIDIDASVDGWDLKVAFAHEMGHVVLHTKMHTQGGIMGGVDDRMWDVDRELACETIDVCVP
jgi:hypothetical protein